MELQARFPDVGMSRFGRHGCAFGDEAGAPAGVRAQDWMAQPADDATRDTRCPTRGCDHID
jgi:hypothetical protein